MPSLRKWRVEGVGGMGGMLRILSTEKQAAEGLLGRKEKRNREFRIRDISEGRRMGKIT